MNHNTEEMTLMAKATERSGRDVGAMTQRMQTDARLVKFLAEIAAVFLPVTAIAVSLWRSFHDRIYWWTDVSVDNLQHGLLFSHSTRQRTHAET